MTLNRRILATRWPEKEPVNDQTQGVPLATMQALANYWATKYDWRKVEAKLKCLAATLSQKLTDLIFILFTFAPNMRHALPLIITHGWPGSIIEQLKIIGPLTDPTALWWKC
jgi:hypothetical protein